MIVMHNQNSIFSLHFSSVSLPHFNWLFLTFPSILPNFWTLRLNLLLCTPNLYYSFWVTYFCITCVIPRYILHAPHTFLMRLSDTLCYVIFSTCSPRGFISFSTCLKYFLTFCFFRCSKFGELEARNLWSDLQVRISLILNLLICYKYFISHKFFFVYFFT